MKKILIVVDLQKGFINENTIDTYNKISNLLKLNIFDKVIASKYINRDNSNIEKFMNWKGLKDEESQELMPDIKKYADYIITKQDYFSAVIDETKEILRIENNGEMPESIFICGLDTECCVLKTAVDFFEHGIRPLVLANYCFSTPGYEFHNAGILSLNSLIGDQNIIREDILNKEQINSILNKN